MLKESLIDQEEPVTTESTHSIASTSSKKGNKFALRHHVPGGVVGTNGETDKASQYDYCMVLPIDKKTGDLSEKCRGYIRTMRV